MEKLGIGPEVLCLLNKKLIYARLTGKAKFELYSTSFILFSSNF